MIQQAAKFPDNNPNLLSTLVNLLTNTIAGVGFNAIVGRKHGYITLFCSHIKLCLSYE